MSFIFHTDSLFTFSICMWFGDGLVDPVEFLLGFSFVLFFMLFF